MMRADTIVVSVNMLRIYPRQLLEDKAESVIIATGRKAERKRIAAQPFQRKR